MLILLDGGRDEMYELLGYYYRTGTRISNPYRFLSVGEEKK